mgnify:CR=1 FL=1
MKSKTLAVYCGSSSGNLRCYTQETVALGTLMAKRGVTLVYGGARFGLMGALADSVLAGGGDVIGVIPESMMASEVAHPGLERLEIVASMHERKARMMSLAHGLIALPGGYGTLEELFEALAWSQLCLHAKPVGLLNVNHYFDGLLSFLDRSVEEGFVSIQHRRLLLDARSSFELFNRLSESF